MALAGIVFGILGAANSVIRTYWPSKCDRCQHRRLRHLSDGTPIMFCARARPMVEQCDAFLDDPPANASGPKDRAA